jgi:hypothetical protein
MIFLLHLELNRRVSDGSAKMGRIADRQHGVLAVFTLVAHVRGCVQVMGRAKTDNAGIFIINR